MSGLGIRGAWWPAACVAGALVVSAGTLHAQSTAARPPLIGTVGAGAFGAPAPTATPLGGISGRALSRAPDVITRPPRRGRSGVVLVRVEDAPLQRAGVVVDDEANFSPRVVWFPTADAPTWRRDPRVRPVDGWRDLIVSDIVCTPTGACRTRELPVRAPWVARCGCYAFADGWSRLWRVE